MDLNETLKLFAQLSTGTMNAGTMMTIFGKLFGGKPKAKDKKKSKAKPDPEEELPDLPNKPPADDKPSSEAPEKPAEPEGKPVKEYPEQKTREQTAKEVAKQTGMPVAQVLAMLESGQLKEKWQKEKEATGPATEEGDLGAIVKAQGDPDRGNDPPQAKPPESVPAGGDSPDDQPRPPKPPASEPEGDDQPAEPSSWSTALDSMQLGMDAIGIADPTPLVDGINAGISVGRMFTDPERRGDHAKNAAISAVSMVPYVGDFAKLLKVKRAAGVVRRGAKVARGSKTAKATKPAKVVDGADEAVDLTKSSKAKGEKRTSYRSKAKSFFDNLIGRDDDDTPKPAERDREGGIEAPPIEGDEPEPQEQSIGDRIRGGARRVVNSIFGDDEDAGDPNTDERAKPQADNGEESGDLAKDPKPLNGQRWRVDDDPKPEGDDREVEVEPPPIENEQRTEQEEQSIGDRIRTGARRIFNGIFGDDKPKQTGDDREGDTDPKPEGDDDEAERSIGDRLRGGARRIFNGIFGGGGGGDDGGGADGDGEAEDAYDKWTKKLEDGAGKLEEMAGKVGDVVGDIAKAGLAVAGFVKSLELLNSGVLALNRDLAAYNGNIASAYAQADADAIQRDIRKSDTLDDPLVRLNREQSELKDSMDEFTVPLQSIGIGLQGRATQLVNIIAGFAGNMTMVPEYLQIIADWINGDPLKPQEPAWREFFSDVSDGKFDGKRPEFNRDKP